MRARKRRQIDTGPELLAWAREIQNGMESADITRNAVLWLMVRAASEAREAAALEAAREAESS